MKSNCGCGKFLLKIPVSRSEAYECLPTEIP